MSVDDTGRDAADPKRPTHPQGRPDGDQPHSGDDAADTALRTSSESGYRAAPATDVPTSTTHLTTDRRAGCITQPATRFEVEDGDVIAAVAPELSNAAADVLWRVIEKAMRR